MTEKEVIDKLNSIDEDTMTKDIIVPLYKKIFNGKYFDIEFTGGRKKSEQGCDITYYEITHDTRAKEYTGVQVKQGNIDTSKNQNTGIASMSIQAQQAFTKEVSNVSDKKNYKIKAFVILTTGEILPDARGYIVDNFSDKIIRFIDGEKIAKLIMEKYLTEFLTYFKIDANPQKKMVSSPRNIIADFIEEKYPDEVDNLKKSFRAIGVTSYSTKVIIYLLGNRRAKEFQLARALETSVDNIRDVVMELIGQDIVEADEDGITLSSSYFDDYPILATEVEKRIIQLGYESEVETEEVMNRLIR